MRLLDCPMVNGHLNKSSHWGYVCKYEVAETLRGNKTILRPNVPFYCLCHRQQHIASHDPLNPTSEHTTSPYTNARTREQTYMSRLYIKASDQVRLPGSSQRFLPSAASFGFLDMIQTSYRLPARCHTVLQKETKRWLQLPDGSKSSNHLPRTLSSQVV